MCELNFTFYSFLKAWINEHNCFLFNQLLDQPMRYEITNKCSFTLFYFITSHSSHIPIVLVLAVGGKVLVVGAPVEGNQELPCAQLAPSDQW